MACSSCSSGGCSTDKVGGCGSKGGCSSGGCNRLNVFDWLADVAVPDSFAGFDAVEIRFKGGRKEFYRNASRLPLITGDAVVVEAAGSGWHLGHVSLKGELVRLQMRKKKISNDSKDIRPILRVATPDDEQRWQAVRDLENGTMFRARAMVGELRLKMKLSDVEYQADRTRALFYYSAEDRVDFRDLIKRFADEFRVRVEMRQITLRQEAGRIGGIGVCGRELCCSTWLTDFKTVSTTAARYQNLSLNPQKLAGQCGRLKCCLNYELDAYLDALKDIPQVQRPLKTTRGEAFLQKTDIFGRRMWFAFKGDNNWVMLEAARVKELVELNKKGELIENLLPPRQEEPEPEVSAIVEGSLDRLDDQISSSARRRRKKNGPETTEVPAARNSPAARPSREDREGREGREGREETPREARPAREPRQTREDRAPREPREETPREARAPRENTPREQRAPRPGRERGPRPAADGTPTDAPARAPREAAAPREGGAGRSPREVREGRNGRRNGNANAGPNASASTSAEGAPRPAAPNAPAAGGAASPEGAGRRSGGRNGRRGGSGASQAEGGSAPRPDGTAPEARAPREGGGSGGRRRGGGRSPKPE